MNFLDNSKQNGFISNYLMVYMWGTYGGQGFVHNSQQNLKVFQISKKECILPFFGQKLAKYVVYVNNIIH